MLLSRLFPILIIVITTFGCGISKKNKGNTNSKTNTGLDISLTSGNANFIFWNHSPMHPNNGQAVTFQAKVLQNNILKAELIVLEYELYKNENGLPSKKRRENGLWKVIKTWNFDSNTNQADLKFTLEEGFAAHSNIEYIFRITDVLGKRSDRLAIFDAGTSPWPKDKVLLYSTTRQPMQKTINICFFPDVDFQKNWNLFKNDVEKLIYDGYHQNKKIGENKDKWAFYFTDGEMDGKATLLDVWNEDNYPDFVTSNRIEGIDAFGLLHRNPYSDHALLSGNINFVNNSLFTSESYNLGTAVHETAHAIFRLSDEYDQCACFQTGVFSNVFETLQNCQNFAQSSGFEVSECRPVTAGDGNTWFTPETNSFFQTKEECEAFNRANNYPEDSCRNWLIGGNRWVEAKLGTCIMHDDGDQNIRQFQSVCSYNIDQYYQRLKEDPVAMIPISNNTILGERVENFWGYEKVIMLEIATSGEKASVEVNTVKMGIPSKNILKQNDLDLYFMTKNEKIKHKIHIANPSGNLFENGKSSNWAEKQGTGRTFINIPFHDDFAKVNCQHTKEKKLKIKSATLESEKSSVIFDLQQQLKKAKMEFKKQR